MIIDKVEVVFAGGNGGNGKVSFRKNKKGPDGGNGGNGGSLYVEAKNDIKLLNQFSVETDYAAENGVPGANNDRSGRKGEDLIIFLPVGTSVVDKWTNQVFADLTYEGERVLIAKGGIGGKGNAEFKTAEDTAPQFAEKGTKGEKKEIVLTLKFIADFGLIGLPNAGKSSLINELTNAGVKTADYPFTTLTAALGVFDGKVIADIPGLIEGASKGKGLGIEFLKHIEKVKVLLHCISLESTDPLGDYKTVRNELGEYKKSLLEKEEIILLTKTDLVEKEVRAAAVQELKKTKKKILPVSIHDLDSIVLLKDILRTF
jgi:GTP-binding protein